MPAEALTIGQTEPVTAHGAGTVSRVGLSDPGPDDAPPIGPRFIIIGAMRAATAWMAQQLGRHHGIRMRAPEPHFFTRNFARGEAWYLDQFRGTPQDMMCGERAAEYLADPLAPGRIARLLPRVRLIVQLRDPVERAYSEYCMLLRRGEARGTIADHLEDAGRGSRILGGGLYAQHLGRYFDHFPRSQIKLLLYDHISETPEAMLAVALMHVGAWVHVPAQGAPVRVNDSRAPVLPPSLRRLLQPGKKLVEPWRDSAWFGRLHARLAAPGRYPPLTPDMRARLQDFYRADLEMLARITGRDLSGWTASPVPDMR